MAVVSRYPTNRRLGKAKSCSDGGCYIRHRQKLRRHFTDQIPPLILRTLCTSCSPTYYYCTSHAPTDTDIAYFRLSYAAWFIHHLRTWWPDTDSVFFSTRSPKPFSVAFCHISLSYISYLTILFYLRILCNVSSVMGNGIVNCEGTDLLHLKMQGSIMQWYGWSNKNSCWDPNQIP